MKVPKAMSVMPSQTPKVELSELRNEWGLCARGESYSFESSESSIGLSKTPLTAAARRPSRTRHLPTVWRRHRCNRNHRNVETFLRCAVPRCEWITGHGDFILIAWCSTPTISRWPTLTEALDAKRGIDCGGCGHACHRAHEIIRVDLDQQRRRADA